MSERSFLKKGNDSFKNESFEESIKLYEKALGVYEELDVVIKNNIYLSKKRMSSYVTGFKGRQVFLEYIDKLMKDVGGDIVKKAYPKIHGVGVKKSDPLVSIIMPTWNRGYIIGEAISSVIDQTYGKWELLVCDDASDDNTQEVVKSFNDERIKYKKLEKTNGAVARNHGLRAAAGSVYAFLDSDNIWSPNYLEEIVSVHSENEAAIVYTAFLDTQISNDKFVSVDKKYREFSYLDIAFRNYIDLNTVSFKPFVYFELGGFDPSLPRQQDWDLLVRYTAHYTPLGLDKPLVLYRRNEEWGQVTQTQKNIDTRKIVLEKNKYLARNYKDGDLPKKINLKTLAEVNKKILKTIAIKISAPNKEVAHEWGDYHFAHQLGRALYKFGWEYRVDCQDSWYSEESHINIMLRGRHKFDINKSNAFLNIIWVISHPDRLVSGELNEYDHIFIASDFFVNKVKKVTKVPVTVLHQATDPEVFKPSGKDIELENKIIFIGNSRNEFRTMVKWSYEENIPIGLWGSRWEQFVGSENISGQYIPNDEVSNYYSSCDILLNDHWETMKNNGFISNRIFDASAAGAFIITDKVVGIEHVFRDCIVSVNNKEEFLEALRFYQERPDLRDDMVKKSFQLVSENHTFLHRAEAITVKIDEIISFFPKDSKVKK